MYKVFFNNRVVFISAEREMLADKKKGLVYHYTDYEELTEVISSFSNMKKVKELTIMHENLETIWEDFTSYFKFIEAAGGVVFNTKDELLIINRHDKFDLPKGKIEKNESFEQAAIREVMEECGIEDLKITGKITNTYHMYLLKEEPVLKCTHWYSILHKGKKMPVPQTKENIVEAKWIKKEDVNLVVSDTYLSIVDVLIEAGLV